MLQSMRKTNLQFAKLLQNLQQDAYINQNISREITQTKQLLRQGKQTSMNDIEVLKLLSRLMKFDETKFEDLNPRLKNYLEKYNNNLDEVHRKLKKYSSQQGLKRLTRTITGYKNVKDLLEKITHTRKTIVEEIKKNPGLARPWDRNKIHKFMNLLKFDNYMYDGKKLVDIKTFQADYYPYNDKQQTIRIIQQQRLPATQKTTATFPSRPKFQNKLLYKILSTPQTLKKSRQQKRISTQSPSGVSTKSRQQGSDVPTTSKQQKAVKNLLSQIKSRKSLKSTK